MTQSQVLGIIQSVLSAVGGFLVAKGVTDSVTTTTGIGALIGLIGMVWAFVDKTATATSTEEALKQAGSFIGGLFIAQGKLSIDQLNTWLGLLSALVPTVLSIISRGTSATTTTTSSTITTTPTSTTTTSTGK